MTHINTARSSVHTLARIATLVALTFGLIVAGAGTASARPTTMVDEGLERNHSGLSFVRTGASTTSRLVLNSLPTPLNPQRAHTGIGHAELFSGSAQGMTMVQRRFAKPTNHLNCYAWAWVNPEGGAKTVYFEAYNPATPTAPLMVSARRTVSGTGYQQIATGYFYGPSAEIVVRVSIVGDVGRLRVDDLKVSCVAFD